MPPIFNQYLELTKPRVVALIVFTAIIGMFLAVPGMVPLRPLLAGTVGIWLAAASAAAINHLIDQRIDRLMARTAHRPLATGALTPTQVLAFAIVLGALSMTILIAFVNPLTAALTFASLICYAIVYTGWLKRATPQNIVIGGIAGAAPPVLGWAAVTGHVHPHALLLCLIIFVWTPPHFWALAIFRRDDYSRAQVPMLPVTHGVVYTAFSAAVVEGLWHQVSAQALVVLLALCCALLALALFATSQLGRRLGFSREDRITILFCGSKKSLATGVPMANVLFASSAVGTIVLPLMLFHQIQLMVCAVIAQRYAMQAGVEVAPGGPAADDESAD